MVLLGELDMWPFNDHDRIYLVPANDNLRIQRTPPSRTTGETCSPLHEALKVNFPLAEKNLPQLFSSASRDVVLSNDEGVSKYLQWRGCSVPTHVPWTAAARITFSSKYNVCQETRF